MKWVKSDLERYLGAKEYIDTLLVPLLPFEFSDDHHLTKNAFQIELLSIFLHELEKEFTGRIVLSPHYYYLKSSNKDAELERLNTWMVDAKKQPFEHIFFVTFDATWKKEETAMDGTLLWLPAAQSGDLQSKEIVTLIRDQVEQVSELIQSYW